MAHRIVDYFWNISPRISADFLTRSSDKYFQVGQPLPLTRRLLLRKIWTILNAFYLFLCTCRSIYATAVIRFDLDPTGWLYYDPIFYVIFNVYKIANIASTACFIPLPVFCIALDYQLHLKHFTGPIHLLYELAFTNKAHFFALNGTLIKPQFNWHQPIGFINNALRLIRCLRNPPSLLLARIQFKVPRFNYAPYVFKRTRVQLVLHSLQLQLLVAVGHLILYAGAVIVAPYSYFAIYLPHAQCLTGALVALVEHLFVTYNIINICSGLLCTAHLFRCVHLVIRENVRLLNWALQKACKSVNKGKISVDQLAAILRFYFFREHSSLLLSVIHFDQNTASRGLLTAFISHVSVNIFIISALYQLKMSTPLTIGILGILTIQVGASVVFLTPMIQQIHYLYSCTGPLFTAQTVLQSQKSLKLLQTKLKLLQYLRVLWSKSKIDFTVGPLGHVTSMALAEFLVFYTASLFKVLKYLRSL